MQKPYLLLPHPRFPVIFCFCYIIYSEVSHEKLLCNWFHFPKRTLIFRRSSRYLLGALYTICIMLFSAGSSPVVNSMGTDSSVFFTIGRSMLSGKASYRIFDHKGWYVYFFNYLGACLSSKTTIGLFIIECAFMIINVILYLKLQT